jgi:lantibiotic biosynthesis protein
VYVPLRRLLIRAPLLPLRDLPHAARALAAHPLGESAIAIASPSLAAAKPGPARTRALERYARRAAFRPTPSGLLAGVCVGTLGARDAVATGTPAAVLGPSRARLDALARALLDDPAVRGGTGLRVAPSLLRRADGVRWIAAGDPFGEWRDAELDDRLAAILDAGRRWTAWPRLRDAARGDTEADDDLDDLLLTLVDDGLLQTDLAPPLVGPPGEAHLEQRLRALGLAAEAQALEASVRSLRAGDRRGGETALARLPGRVDRAVQATLVHRPSRPPRIGRAAVARGAGLVPLLIRLQDALAPPAAERLASAALADALDACTEVFGAGAFDLDALAAGAYGVDLDEDETPSTPPHPALPPLLAYLAEAFARAARDRQPEVALDAAALSRILGEPSDGALPESAELFLIPTPARRGERPGTGWLLGLHAPAGASLGRFAHALGPAGADALAEIAAAERTADGERLDVAFAPSTELADLCAHPPARRRALAISRWTAGDDLTLADLALVADPARPDGLALRDRAGPPGSAVIPSPLWRVRSSTAPTGPARLAVGWALHRQHAPWAFTPGPLAALEALPRIRLDGFVIAPASWRVPGAVREGRSSRAALTRWRRASGVPQHVQIGEGDALVPVDLNAPSAPRDLAGVDRVHEIWPPLGATVDRDGRRIELVVPVVRTTPGDQGASELGRVPPPAEAPPAEGWRTFKLFGPGDLQDAVLLEVVEPAVTEATRAGQIDAWFFLRYEDGPGRRPHLRLRARAADGDPTGFERRLRDGLVEARAAGALISVETSDYFPERGRFQAGELDGLHAIFQADSQAVLALLAAGDAHPAVTRARLFDAIAAAFGLDAADREEVAGARRAAAEHAMDPHPDARREDDAAFRAHARELRLAFGEDQHQPLGVLPTLRARVAAGVRGFAPARRPVLLSTVLHLSSVRLAGGDPDGERLGYTFWQRAREGLRRAPAAAR